MPTIQPYRSRSSVLMLVAAAYVLATYVPAALGETRTTPAAPAGGVVRFSPAMQPGSLLARPESDAIEFPLGQRLRIADFKRLNAAAQRMRKAATTRARSVWSVKPATGGQRLDEPGEFAARLKLPDNETLQLPSGRRVTAGQLRVLRPLIEKRLGHSLSASPERPKLDGPATKLGAATDFKQLLQRPDSDVVESPHGVRMTVGELKQALERAKATAKPSR